MVSSSWKVYISIIVKEDGRRVNLVKQSRYQSPYLKKTIGLVQALTQEEVDQCIQGAKEAPKKLGKDEYL